MSICPIQENPWEITPNKTINMRYTIVTCDASMEDANINEWWKNLTGRKNAE